MSAQLLAFVMLSLWQPAVTQQMPQPQANPQILGQAYDRCMTTYAVRLSKTHEGDAEIYAQARQSCAALHEALVGALRARPAPAQAAEALRMLEVQARPNFMALLARIRSDRAKREATYAAPAPPASSVTFDATNPAHCEVALGVLAIMAEALGTSDAADLRRRQVLAQGASAAQFSSDEATAARKAIWPVIQNRLSEDQGAFLRAAQTCPR